MSANARLESTQNDNNQLVEALKRIKDYDTQLTGRLRSALWLAHPFGGSESEKTHFVAEVQTHVNEMANIGNATFKRDPTEYYWLADAAARWKFICETALGTSITLPVFGDNLLTLTSLDNREITRFVQFKAHTISSVRRHSKAVKTLEEIMRVNFQGTTPTEETWDWLQAEQYFAKDMLYGTGDLYRYVGLGDVRSAEVWKYLHHDTFDRLEGVWLGDVLRLRAYECWLERGSPVTSDKAVIDSDYKNALSQFSNRMRDEAIKYPTDARGVLSEYMKGTLGLGKGPVFENQEPFLTLIDKKARRIEEVTGYGDHSRAQKYVVDFYRYLYGAVVTDDERAKKEAKTNVVTAFTIGEGADGKCPIASCFEAFVMVYYIGGADASAAT